MKTLTIKMLWNDHHQKWLMINSDDKLIYDFFDCRTVNETFEFLNKTKASQYKITVEGIDE